MTPRTQVLEGAQVYLDPRYPPTAMADLLGRTTRLLQVALDLQFQENEESIKSLNVGSSPSLSPNSCSTCMQPRCGPAVSSGVS